MDGSILERSPLHIPRDALIARLQEKIDADEAKREASKEKSQKTVDEFLAAAPPSAVRSLAEWISSRYGDTVDFEKAFEGMAATEEEKLNPQTKRAVRALELATDKEIEVKPTDDIYHLL